MQAPSSSSLKQAPIPLPKGWPNSRHGSATPKHRKRKRKEGATDSNVDRALENNRNAMKLQSPNDFIKESYAFLTPRPAVRYRDLGGMESVIPVVRQLVELPLRHPQIFRTVGIPPPRGVLMYGPPGSGKTMIAKAVAAETGAFFFLLICAAHSIDHLYEGILCSKCASASRPLNPGTIWILST